MFVRYSILFLFVYVSYLDLVNGKDLPLIPRNGSVPVLSDTTNSFLESSSTPKATVESSTFPPAVASSGFPETAKWNVTGNDGHVCILVQSAIRISFKYSDQETGKLVTANLDVPPHAAVEGVCNNVVQTMSLIFYETWNLTFVFARNDTKYSMSGAALSYKLQHGRQPFPHAKEVSNSSVFMVEDDDKDFKTEVGSSSVCTSQLTILDYTESSLAGGVMRIDLYDTRIEAFRGNASNADFSVMGSRCSNDEISLLVPIIVGACLAGLIVFVLVAYLIGRHHSKRGYLNV